MRRFILVIAALAITGCGNSVTNGTPDSNTGVQITQVLPSEGPINGGTVVEIHGTNLSDGSGSVLVSFGGNLADVLFVTDAMVRVEAPAAGAPGTVAVSITHAAGATSYDGYTYGDATFGGAAVLQTSRYLSDAQFPGATERVDAFVYFATPTTESLLSAVPAELGCGAPDELVSGTFALVDAGESVELEGPAVLALPRQAGPTYYPTDPIIGSAEFVPDGVYDIHGDTWTETGVLRTPEDFTVIAPDITVYPYLIVSRSEDLLLEWTAPTQTQTSSFFYVQLEGWAGGVATGEVVRCWGQDSGTMTIPAGTLAELATADRMVVKMVRRVDTQWQVSANKSLGQSASTLQQVGLLGLQ